MAWRVSGRRIVDGRMSEREERLVFDADKLAIRFFAKVNKNGPTVYHDLGPCWMWTSTAISNSGYGLIGVGGKNGFPVGSHRVGFFLANGFWPDPVAMHRCDNKLCVKAMSDELGPAHIIRGTAAENTADIHAKGRWPVKTHCPQGHPYSEYGTHDYMGRLRCSVCRKLQFKLCAERKKARLGT